MKIAILGAGISGLSAAWKLRRRYPKAEIAVFEKGKRVGGWIESRQCGPFLFECGPRTFQKERCKELLSLIDEVGLSKELLWSKGGSRYLLKEGKLRSIGSLWPTIGSMVWRDLVTKRGDGAEESIYSFARRRFGEEAAEQFFDPMALGVYGGDPKRLSLQSCFPFLAQWEKKYRSIVLGALRAKKGDHRLFTLRRGMGSLCEALVEKGGFDVRLETGIEEIRGDGVVAGGRFYEADQIYSALPVEAIAALAQEICPVRSESFHVVCLGYLGEVVSKKGYGYLVPSREKEVLMGMIWDTSIFPVEGQTKLTCMVRGSTPLASALEAAKRHLKVEKGPDQHISIEVKVPQYELKHREKIEFFQTRVKFKWPHVFLLGNYLSGASVNACIFK